MSSHRVPAPVRTGPGSAGSARRPAARIVGVLLMIWGTLIAVAVPASAGVGFVGVPTFPVSAIVGQTGIPASLSIQNISTTPENSGNVTLSLITLVPSCGTSASPIDCQPAFVDPGVFRLSSTGVGEVGTVCAGVVFAITEIDSVQGKYAFMPPSPVVLGAPGSPTDTCRIGFTFDVLKAPTIDAADTLDLQTNQLAGAEGTASVNGNFGRTGLTSITTVNLASPTVVTTATPATLPVGSGTATDSAVLSGGAGPAPGPTGTITFKLYADPDPPVVPPTCTGNAAFTSEAVPVMGNGTYTSSPPFTPTTVGTFRWVASYSGDANNNPFVSACGAAGETLTVTKAMPTLVTTPSPTAPTVPASVSDSATLNGGFMPTGTITFQLFAPSAPAPPTCTGTPLFTSPAVVDTGNDTYNSAPTTITTPGTYQWVAIYSGDVNNTPVTSACGLEPVTAKITPTIVTVATPPTVPVGTAAHDVATISGGATPSGSITFRLFGPIAGPNPTPDCTGTAVFTSPAVTVTGTGNYSSADFTPSLVGTYFWTATYTGDTLNNAVTTLCGAANETLTVTQATPVVATTASGSVVAGGPTPVTDTATISGGVNPTGTITFRLYGPNNPTCTDPPIFTSSAVPVAGNGMYTSAPGFFPTLAGTYLWTATYSGDANNMTITTACGAANESVVVTPARPTLTTTASGSVPLGGAIHDTAMLAGGANPTGSITFNLFGPDNATCTGAPAFSATVPVTGNGNYDSPNFTGTLPGTYRWIASYSGDVNNAAAGPTACLDPAEAVTITKSNPTLITNASTPVVAGGTIHDTATLSNGTGPTGTITFNLFGPDNATCAGPPAFSATVPVNGNGNYDSPNFTATQAGLYRWVATYSGDTRNNPAGPTACNDPAEQVRVNPTNPLLTTNASGSVPVGGQISDTGTLTGGVMATGTITFTLFGPNNATCTGAPIFTSTATVTGNGTYPSGPFTPIQAGTYRFVASYGGDANNNPATTLCTDPAEAVVVTRVPVGLTTTASPTVNLGSPIRDTATITGGSSPTGTVTFNAYGPNDPTCTGAIASTSTVAVTGAGSYQSSSSFTPTAAGIYRFVATYSGDVNNLPAGPTACNDPAEQVLVRPNPTLTTTASATVPEGGAISDTATLSGGITPTGTITFKLFGPDNAGCTGMPIFTSTATVAGNGVYQSGAFTTSVNGPAGPGTYRFVASYSGDTTNNAAGPTACNDPAEQVVVTNVVPAITITKTPSPTTRPEPGGTFTFTLVVTNPSNEPVTITSLIDNVYGDVNGKGTCTVGAVLAPSGGSYTCVFPGDFFGAAPASQTDTVIVTGIDNEGATVTAQAQATVKLTNVPPSITVVKTASPASRPEPGGTFTFSVVVTNTSIKPVLLTDLVDDIYGDLAGKGTCNVGSTLAASGGTYSCTFPGVFNGVGGQTQTDIVTATAVDNAGNRVSARDDAIVAITSVLPSITVEKTVTPASLPEPGGTFTFRVVVNNTSQEVLTLTTLIDDKYGDLNNRGTCSVPQTLVIGGSYTCTFPGTFMGLSGDTQTDTVTGTAVDSQGRQATAMARATVILTPVPPTIIVKKVADPLTKPEPGGDFTFTVTVTNTSFKQVTLTSLNDDVYGDLNGQGTCKTGPTIVLAPNGGTYTCSFTGPFTGLGGDSQTDTVTAVVVDNRGNKAMAIAQATVTLTNVPPTIAVTKTPDPSSRQAPGGSFTFTVTVKNTTVYPLKLTALTDNIYGDLNGKGDCKTGVTIDPGATYTCAFTGNFSGNAGDRQTDTVTATATNSRNQSVTATAQATVSLTPGPPPPAPGPNVQVRTGALARTGLGLGGPTRLAVAMVLLGALLLLASFRGSWRPAVAVPEGGTSAVGEANRRWAERTARQLRSRLMRGR